MHTLHSTFVDYENLSGLSFALTVLQRRENRKISLSLLTEYPYNLTKDSVQRTTGRVGFSPPIKSFMHNAIRIINPPLAETVNNELRTMNYEQ